MLGRHNCSGIALEVQRCQASASRVRQSFVCRHNVSHDAARGKLTLIETGVHFSLCSIRSSTKKRNSFICLHLSLPWRIPPNAERDGEHLETNGSTSRTVDIMTRLPMYPIGLPASYFWSITCSHYTTTDAPASHHHPPPTIVASP